MRQIDTYTIKQKMNDPTNNYCTSGSNSTSNAHYSSAHPDHGGGGGNPILSKFNDTLGPVTTLILCYILLSLLYKRLRENFILYKYSNYKYRFINSLAPYIYYGKVDMGVKAVLSLDSPTYDVFQRRMKGQEYLSSKLDNNNNGSNKEKNDNDLLRSRGMVLASSLVDCRFALSKVCMPLLRELEFPVDGRNFITNVKQVAASSENGSAGKSSSNDGGMLHVTTEDGNTRLYVGNDAVHTMNVHTFYAPIQNEINRRMEINEGSSSMLRFCPIAMNAELEENVTLVKRLTGMDKVCVVS